MGGFLQALEGFLGNVGHGILHGANSFLNAQQFAQNLRAAADQHEALQQAMRDRDLNMALRQREDDRADAEFSQNLLTKDEPVSKDGTVSRDVQAPGTTLPNGVTIPGQTMSTGLPVEPGRLIDFRGSKYYVPSPQESLSRSLEYERSLAEARNQGKASEPHLVTSGYSSPFVVDPATGQTTPIALPPGVHPTKDNESKPPKYTYNHFTDDSGAVNITRIGEDGTPQIWDGKNRIWATLGPNNRIGPKKDATGENKPIPPGEKARLTNKAVIDRRLSFAKAEADYRNGLQQPEDYARLVFQKQEIENAYEGQLQSLGVPYQRIDFTQQPVPRGTIKPPSATAQAQPSRPSTQASPSAQVSGPPQRAQQTQRGARTPVSAPQTRVDTHADNQTGAQSRQAPARPSASAGSQPNGAGNKVTTLDKVRAFARANKLSETQAIRRVQAEGYRIQGGNDRIHRRHPPGTGGMVSGPGVGIASGI